MTRPRRSSAGRPREGSSPRRGGPGTRLRPAGAAFLASAGLLVLAASFLLAPSGSAAPDASVRLAQSGRFPNGAYFVVTCGFSHRSNDDPIVFPGAPGRSHNHTFVGNRSVSASSTPESLAGGETTCDVQADASGYWMPTVYAGREPVTPLAAIVYYVRRTDDPVTTFPAGLKMVAGDASARTRQPKGIVSWSCGPIGAPPRSSAPQACTADEFLQLQVTFPNCWTGKTLDSADHKRHVAYSTAGRCRASHPVALPTLALIVLFPPVRGADVASGRLGGHADFMNGWDPDVLERLVATLNTRRG